MTLALRYSYFAILAMLANLLAQEFSVLLYSGPLEIYLAIAAGTLAGWVSKYWLDKRYIFMHETATQRDNLTTFLAYGATGVVTTLLFWGFELSFDLLFGTRAARYTGAVIGLGIGYVIKFHLDKRFVFTAGGE